MNGEVHSGNEYAKKLCYLSWDIHNNPELGALSHNATHPTAVQCSSFILSIVTCIIGYAGNITVIFVTGFLMKKNKSHIWFLNLAIADFIFLLLLPLHAVSGLSARWSYGSFMCKFYHFLTLVNMYASIYILVALNIDRALSVAKPIWHMRFLSRKFVSSTCSLIWLSSAICSIPAIFYSDEYYFGEVPQCILFGSDLMTIAYASSDQNKAQEWRKYQRDVCELIGEDFDAPQWSQILFVTRGLVIPLAVIGCVIPLCVILSSNIVIAVHVKNSEKAASSRLYRVVIAAVLAFFCTRTPLVLAQVIILVAAYTLELTLMYKVILILPLLSSIAATNTFLNPMVYVLVGKQVRNEIYNFFRKY